MINPLSHNEWELTEVQLLDFYEVEKDLANRLRSATREQRLYLYRSLYDELYRRIPYHPMLTRKVSAAETERTISILTKLLNPFLSPNCTYLEIGAGDCALAFKVSSSVKKVYAVDVSNVITMNDSTPANCELILSDGITIPVPPASIDFAFSNQLIEHLHPYDTLEQLKSICAALVPGGKYLCITPNRLAGPGDISRYFDDVATGFHLKEYTYDELWRIFSEAGFSSVRGLIGHQHKGIYVETPMALVRVLEGMCRQVVRNKPRSTRQSVTRKLPWRLIKDVRILATK